MRNIIDGLRSHNGTGPALAAALAILVVASGCGGSGERPAASACGVGIDTSAWRAFVALGGRLAAGETVSRGDKEAFAAEPGVLLWREGLGPQSPTPVNIANWLEAAFDAVPERGRGKANPNRKLMADSYRYSWANRDEVDTLLAGFRREGACDLAAGAEFWIGKGKLPPGGPAVVFLPTLAEIRIARDTLLVDTGVLVAGGPDQAVDQMVSLLYRNYQAIPGDNPATLEGGPSVANAFRVITNEAVAGWIAGTLDTSFRSDHPRLGDIALVPETFYETALRAMAMADRLLPDMVAKPEVMAARGRSLTNFLTGQNAYGQLGFAMASVIEARLGEERLRDAGRTVPGFLAAYQEAALRNPEPRPEPGAPGTRLPETMPPFAPGVYDGLIRLVTATFPPGS